VVPDERLMRFVGLTLNFDVFEHVLEPAAIITHALLLANLGHDESKFIKPAAGVYVLF